VPLGQPFHVQKAVAKAEQGWDEIGQFVRDEKRRIAEKAPTGTFDEDMTNFVRTGRSVFQFNRENSL
jgi:hypothetical protein